MSNITSKSFVLLALFSFSPVYFSQDSGSSLEEVIVTAQRQAQSLQDVPLAVSSLSNKDLLEQQIETPGDLALTVPSLRFSGSRFGGAGGFEIRGITNLATSTTADAGVAVHINDLAIGVGALQSNRIMDMSRVEVIRGPAGTLFGASAVGGSINFITNKAEVDSFYGSTKIDLGDYGRLGTDTVFNIPLDDSVALRIAASTLKQDGLIENIYKDGFQDLDNRNDRSYRATLTFEASDATTIHLIHDVYDEDSNRNVFVGRYCVQAASMIDGCLRVNIEDQKFEVPHPQGTLTPNLLLLAGVDNPTTSSDLSGVPQEWWQANVRGTPIYDVEIETTQLLIEHELEDMTVNIGIQRRLRDYLRRGVYASPDLVKERFNVTPVTPGGLVQMSGYGPGCDLLSGTQGVTGGCIADTINYDTSYDNNYSYDQVDVIEFKLVSDFDGQHNFLFGANYADSFVNTSYEVVAPGLDVLALQTPAAFLPLAAQPLAAVGIQAYPGNFNTITNTSIENQSVFGEYYFQARDDLRLTFGLRYSEDKKAAPQGVYFLNVLGFRQGVISDAQAAGVTQGAVPTAAAWEALFCPEVGNFCPVAGALPTIGSDYAALGLPSEVDFAAFTGRFVIDYFINEDSMMYVSLNKGFKGGGINPAIDPAVFPDTPLAFPESDVIGFEIGFKNEFPDQGVRFNVSAFYNAFENYHVSKLVNRVALNEGLDVDIMGLEADLLYVPPSVPEFSLNANFSYISSEIADGTSQINPVNKDLQLTGGGALWHQVMDAQSNRFIITKEAMGAIYSSWLAEATTLGQAVTPLDGIVALTGGATQTAALLANIIPIEFHGDRSYGAQTPVSYFAPALGVLPSAGHLPSIVGTRSTLQVMAQLHGYDLVDGTDIKDGLEQDISGNQLTHPDLTASVGAAYLLDAGPINVNFRLDYYYRGERYISQFNLPSDKLSGWDEINAQITLAPSDNAWFVQFYGQNITDEQNLEFLNISDQNEGYVNTIIGRERARYGIRAGYNF